MARIYSARLAERSAFTGGPTAVYTVPSGTLAVVRSISMSQDAGALSVGLVLRTGGAILAGVQAAALYVCQPIDLRSVLNGGEQLSFQVIAGTWSISVSGYELTP